MKINFNHDSKSLQGSMGIEKDRSDAIIDAIKEVFTSGPDSEKTSEMMEKCISVVKDETELFFLGVKFGQVMEMADPSPRIQPGEILQKMFREWLDAQRQYAREAEIKTN